MNRILVINTGGTIGMAQSKNGLYPEKGLLKNYCKQNIWPSFEQVVYEWLDLDPLIDSSQITIKQLNYLAALIEQHYQQYDAFIVIHGTDTLAYTSSFLGLALRNLQKSVVITGAMRSVVEENSDGYSNLTLSIRTALENQHQGVLVCFNGLVLPGEHVTKIDSSRNAAFDSLVSRALCPINPTHRKLERLVANAHQIDIFTFYPGYSVSSLKNMIESDCQAILLRSYGSGNLPIDSELEELLLEAQSRNKLVINMSQCIASQVDMARYQIGSSLIKCGVISGLTMTLEAIVMKLQILLSQKDISREEIVRQLSTSWARELPDPDT